MLATKAIHTQKIMTDLKEIALMMEQTEMIASEGSD